MANENMTDTPRTTPRCARCGTEGCPQAPDQYVYNPTPGKGWTLNLLIADACCSLRALTKPPEAELPCWCVFGKPCPRHL